jgi:hypothetical protein
VLISCVNGNDARAFFMGVTQEARTALPLAEGGRTTAGRASGNRLWLIFWIGVPLFIGLLLGWAQAGSARQLDRGLALLFVMSGVLPAWWSYGLLAAALRRLVPSLPTPLLLLLAPVIGSMFLRPLYLGRKALFGIPHNDAAFPSLQEPVAMVISLLYGNLLGIICFPLMALFFRAMFDFDVMGGRQQARADLPAVLPPAVMPQTGVLARIPARLGADVRALVAAEHYLRVITAEGEAMVLYRLGDAIRDMELAGIRGVQVHRSYWVATAAITGNSRDGSRISLEIAGGLTVPVSRSYRQALKAATGL